jgi:hypothetical protein
MNLLMSGPPAVVACLPKLSMRMRRCCSRSSMAATRCCMSTLRAATLQAKVAGASTQQPGVTPPPRSCRRANSTAIVFFPRSTMVLSLRLGYRSCDSYTARVAMHRPGTVPISSQPGADSLDARALQPHLAISSSVGGSWRVRASQLRHSAGTVLGSYSRSLPAAAQQNVRQGPQKPLGLQLHTQQQRLMSCCQCCTVAAA